MAKAQEDGAHIAVEDFVIHRIALRLERRATFLETGIVEGHVEPAEAIDGISNQALDAGPGGDVGLDRERRTAERLTRPPTGIDLRLPPARDNHSCGAR